MKTRVVRVEDGYWRIRSGKRELRAEEQQALVDYFREIRFPHRVVGGRVHVPESVPWSDIYERLQHFYDGRAEVLTF